MSDKYVSLNNSEVELIKKPKADEEHKNLTPADGDDRNQQSQIDDQDNAAGDADAIVQEEAGA